jgi:hypothetical protein
MRRPVGLVALAVLAPALLGAGSSRVYRNDAAHVRAFAPPAGWELAPQSSYPRLLASYSHSDGARLTLSGQRVASTVTALDLAEQARVPLEKQGFTAIRITKDGDRARLDADLDGGHRFAKQIYVVAGGFAYVVTLISPLAASGRMAPDFEDAVRSLQVGPPPVSSPDRAPDR